MITRVLLVALIGTVTSWGATTAAMAEARDAADRSLRSDHNALENDIRRDQLKPSGRPNLFPWSWNGDATSQPDPKSKKKGSGRQ